MADRRKAGIPVMKAILTQDLLLIFRLVDIREIDPLCLAGCDQKLFSVGNVFFFLLAAEPLLNLIFCLRTYYKI